MTQHQPRQILDTPKHFKRRLRSGLKDIVPAAAESGQLQLTVPKRRSSHQNKSS